jgi:hypothetical protein
VLEQVGKAGLAGLFVLRAHVVPDIDRNDWGLVILMDDDTQAIVQREFGIGDFDIGGATGAYREQKCQTGNQPGLLDKCHGYLVCCGWCRGDRALAADVGRTS